MEDEVRSAVSDGTEDLVLSKLIEITIRSINSGLELFPDLLNAPAFYERYFRPWVQSTLDEKEALDRFHNSALTAAGISNRE